MVRYVCLMQMFYAPYFSRYLKMWYNKSKINKCNKLLTTTLFRRSTDTSIVQIDDLKRGYALHNLPVDVKATGLPPLKLATCL